VEIIAESRYRFVIPRHGRMRVPGVVFATRVLIPDPAADHALEQVANVAELPGIVEASYAMPDVHWGYGFPIGGVAATGVARGGVVSPGGVGFDIACGVRLLAADLGRDDLLPVLGQVMDRLAAVIPCGAGRGGIWKLHGRAELDKLLAGGAGHAVACGHGGERDLDRCEDHGVAGGADPAQVSSRAVDRGLHQVGSLGPGNHFLEVQAVDRVFDLAAAQAFGLAEGQVCVMIHCGSRGLGHQVCSDHVLLMDKAMARYGIAVPDWQLACAPVTSPEGRRYLGALAAAANYARANRQVLAAAASAVLAEAAGAPLHLVYDVAHNLATLETHPVGGVPVRLCVHRKGATRALPPRASRSARGPARCRAAGPHSRLDGDCVLCPGRGGPRRRVRLGLPRRGPADEPRPGRPLDRRPATAAAARTPGHRRARRLGPRPGRRGPAGVQGHHPGGRGGRRGGAVPEGGHAGAARRHQGLTSRPRRHVDHGGA